MKQQPVSKITRRRGMALVIVIGALALATMLLLAMFSLTESEYKSTQSYVAGLSAKQFADAATAIVTAQIQNGQNTTQSSPGARTVHATQPGMVRVYQSTGGFLRAYKLYSSSQMKVDGPNESNIFTQETFAPENWHTMPARYVDLNEPVLRPSLGGGAGADAVSVYYPVIDPRAAYNFVGTQYTRSSPPPVGAKTTQLEGFWYEDSTVSAGSAKSVTYATARTPTQVSGDPTKLRVPMPVEWIYFLQDGTMGTLDASNKFVGATPGVTPSVTNPMVARVAFWTDDETCKVNINTASEPTFMSTPFYYHDRDRRWASFPAAASEYQRYPGHPATVALSAVLAPNMRLDPVRPSDDGFGATDKASIVAIKESIYNLAPKVSIGGSLSGTVPFMNDFFSTFNGEGNNTAQNVNTAVARAERLYASVDEMLFRDGEYDPATGRVAATYDIPGSSGRRLFDHDTLERSRFFLTAHSRAPEFSIYGLPRVCMWPVADERAHLVNHAPPNGIPARSPDDFRTNYDNMIALCATLRNATTGSSVANSYFFRRAEAHHSTYDVTGTTTGFPPSAGLERNSQLLEYLVYQMSNLAWPQNSTLGNSPNFVDKYGVDNVRQLAVQFFDYVRSTNLYDGILARSNDGMPANGLSGTNLYVRRDEMTNRKLTYTEQRVTPPATNINAGANSAASRQVSDDESILPGHGQVTPAVWSTGGKNYMGFGRMFTLSEVGFHFICTADGKNDEYAVDFEGAKSGGGTAFRDDPTVSKGLPQPSKNSAIYPQLKLPPDRNAVWWSNFPPLSANAYPPNGSLRYGTKDDKPRADNTSFHPLNHPGYDPNNWNLTLGEDTPLEENEKRIQPILNIETFCAMLGWTSFYPEWVIELDGDWIAQIKIKSPGKQAQSLFSTAGPIRVKSDGNLYNPGNRWARPSGGHSGPTTMAGGRGGRSQAVDGEGHPLLMGSDRNYDTNNTSGHNALANYAMVGNFITVVARKPDGSPEDMELTFPNGEMRINIYDKHEFDTLNRQPIQRIGIRFENSALRPPRLVYNNYPFNPGVPLEDQEGKGGLVKTELNYNQRVDSFGNIRYRRSTQGPHWWCFNKEGCLGRMTGRVNAAWWSGTAEKEQFWTTAPRVYGPAENDTPVRQVLRGRLDNEGSGRGIGWTPPGTPDGIGLFPPEELSNGSGGFITFESDTVRTMVPAVGDYRMIAARYEVPSNMWMRHPMWNDDNRKQNSIHSFSNYHAANESGYDLPDGLDPRLMVAGINYGNPTTLTDRARIPDLPPDTTWARAANSFGDFDTGVADARDGPYVNKPDEGNFFAGNHLFDNISRFYRSGYFYESWHNSDDWRSGVYMTPNRMVSSPVMFGSLPTGVWNTGGGTAIKALDGTSLASTFPARPWQTLLFRPYVQSNLPGFGSKPIHPGDAGPRDHFLLDLFFMPVVEPYAISEPLSVAGRLNMNYQIMPFTHIRRATGMHALMKGELITAIPDGDAYFAKTFKPRPPGSPEYLHFYSENASPQKFWHRPINVEETLVQFEEKFNLSATGIANGLFRSASQICEMHLIPDVRAGVTVGGGESLPTLKGLTRTSRPIAMKAFWQNHKATGDNVRERPYSNLYSRLTTRSNTFRVHVRAQVIKKARSTSPAVFDPDKDAVLSEYRGSTLLERFIDPSDTEHPLPDYAAAGNPLALPPLDTFYQFRVIENKRFNP